MDPTAFLVKLGNNLSVSQSWAQLTAEQREGLWGVIASTTVDYVATVVTPDLVDMANARQPPTDMGADTALRDVSARVRNICAAALACTPADFLTANSHIGAMRYLPAALLRFWLRLDRNLAAAAVNTTPSIMSAKLSTYKEAIRSHPSTEAVLRAMHEHWPDRPLRPPYFDPSVPAHGSTVRL